MSILPGQRASWETVTFLKHLFFSPTKTKCYILSLKKKKILVWLQSELCDDCPAGGILEHRVSISIVVTTHMSDNIYIKDQLSYSHPNFQTPSSLHSQQVQAAELGLVLRALCLALSQGWGELLLLEGLSHLPSPHPTSCLASVP